MKRKTWLHYFLETLIIIQGVTALYGGGCLVLAPDGSLLGLPLEYLANTPFNGYFFPGFFLGFFLGLIPLTLVYTLWRRPQRPYMNVLNIYNDMYFAWTYTLYLGIVLIIYMDLQIMMIGYHSKLQVAYALLGVLILIITLMPEIKRYYELPKES